LVLEHLQAHLPDQPIRYWRNKAGHELDFVLAHGRDQVDVIECKWTASAFHPAALQVFRNFYPNGRNYLVTPGASPAYSKRAGKLVVRVCTPLDMRL
jgi:hypothetical protein